MNNKKTSILLFAVGELQKSIIQRAHAMGLFVVGIDPCPEAYCKDDCDAFEIVGGQDFDGTIAVCKKYGIKAIVTAAADKPLVMMARVAEAMHFPFYSVETAQWSTDKYQMKQRFLEGDVPCARGRLLSAEEVNGQGSTVNGQELNYPVICKPRDNSGSRGVKLCRNQQELEASMAEAIDNSHLTTVLVEEYIEGREFSIEALHHDGMNEVIQFTEKKTTEFPYNVELGHKQPANLTENQRNQIRDIIDRISHCMHFENCASHTELKVNDHGIFVIETSPRSGGDFITSHLTPLSTSINIEDQLLHIALGEPVDTQTGRQEKASAVCFFHFPEGTIEAIDPRFDEVSSWPKVVSCHLNLKVGAQVNKITSSLNRYGQFIVAGESREEVDTLVAKYENEINKLVTLK